MKLTARTRRSVMEFGIEVCLESYRLNLEDGEGCTMIAYSFDCLKNHCAKAGRAINAGREIVQKLTAKKGV